MATAAPGERIVTLDILRGVAVMGILAMNVVGFAMPIQAYANPAAFGSEAPADYLSWAFNFILIDGRMRGLFSFLFGASMLLVIERAEASGRSPGEVHFARMGWLLVFGLLHFVFIWFGDILAGYAMVGMAAYWFRHLTPRELVSCGVAVVAVQAALFGVLAGLAFLPPAPSGSGASALALLGDGLSRGFGMPSPAELSTKYALFGGDYPALVGHRAGQLALPFANLFVFGWETLAYFLFGIALLKTGFFRGAWPPANYRRWALAGFALGLPIYAALAWLIWREGFSAPVLFACSAAATVPIRPLMVVALAALIILLTRRGGALVERIAAAGRAAFTNYLGTSILMTTLFYGYGFGLYGRLSRAELWLVVIAAWALMLLWPKPWLERFRYGPFEWLWRSLARGRFEPIRRVPSTA